jgi:hypothetical protein
VTDLDVLVIGDSPSRIDASLASVGADPHLRDATVHIAEPHLATPWAACTATHVLFLREGDTVLPGAGAHLVDRLDDTDLLLGGHLRRGADSWDLAHTAPEVGSLAHMVRIAADIDVEMSGMVVRRSVLPDTLLPPIDAPAGAVGLLAELIDRAAVRRHVTPVVDVVARPVHLGEPGAVLRHLQGVLHGPLGRHPEAAGRVRRRALALAYLGGSPELPQRWSADEWWGPGAEGRSTEDWLQILRDAHWTAARVAEAARISARGFDGVVSDAPIDAIAALPPQLGELLADNRSLNLMVQELSATVAWLHAEVRNRDERITTLERGGT